MCGFVCMCLLLTKMKGCVAKAAVWRDWMISFRDIEHDRINTESKWRTQRNFCWAHVQQRSTAFLCFLLLTRSLEHEHCRCYLYTFFSNAIFLPKSLFFYLITHTHIHKGTQYLLCIFRCISSPTFPSFLFILLSISTEQITSRFASLFLSSDSSITASAFKRLALILVDYFFFLFNFFVLCLHSK